MIHAKCQNKTDRKYGNTWAFKTICTLFLLIMWYPPASAQYHWNFSENYDSLRTNTAYSFCYKIESIYHPTKIYYEMCEKDNFKEEVVILNTDYGNNPICLGLLRINIDGHDTAIFTDTLGIASIRISSTTQTFKISIFTKPDGFYVPISAGFAPSKIKIVWGAVNDGPSILTICSKIPLKDSDLTKISNLLFLGANADSELYYYYFSDE